MIYEKNFEQFQITMFQK